MPKIVDHDEYRIEILEKCFDLFASKGYDRVTMKEIAREVGVSTGSLYHYFPTKESMLDQMFSHLMKTNIDEYLRRAGDAESVSERLRIMEQFWKDFDGYYQNLLLLAIDIRRNDSDGTSEKFLWRFSEYYAETMAKMLETSYAFGKTLFIYLLGLVMHSILTPGNMTFGDQISRLRNMLRPLVVEMKESPEAAMNMIAELMAMDKVESESI